MDLNPQVMRVLFVCKMNREFYLLGYLYFKPPLLRRPPMCASAFCTYFGSVKRELNPETANRVQKHISSPLEECESGAF